MTDPAALLRNRRRAKTSFLQGIARDDVKDRLGMVNRPFHKAAVVTDWPDLWTGLLPDADKTGFEDTLTLQSSQYDLVVHALSLHWSNDPVGQLIQCKRALKPDGMLLALCLGGQTLSELRASLAQAESAVTGGLSPRVAPMAELRDWGALLQRAGLALPVADSIDFKVEYRDIWHLMQDLRDMGEGNALMDRLRRPTSRTVFEQANELYTSNFASGAGINATFEIIALTGWAPSSEQPQPLRPGSAQTRLADALGVGETSLPD